MIARIGELMSGILVMNSCTQQSILAVSSAMTIPGYLHYAEAITLYSVATSLSGWMVEVGSWQGRSAAVLCAAAKRTGASVICIDSFVRPPGVGYQQSSREKLEANLAKLGLRANAIYSEPSQLVVSTLELPLDLVFIDADHREEAVYYDACAWSARVKAGGYIIFHDYCYPKWPGVTRAVDRWFEQNTFTCKYRCDRLIVFQNNA
jgi:predicted O-methyltransferase YrrM